MRYTPEYCKDYFSTCGNDDMVQLCEAIIDKRDGLGMLWAATDIEGRGGVLMNVKERKAN